MHDALEGWPVPWAWAGADKSIQLVAHAKARASQGPGVLPFGRRFLTYLASVLGGCAPRNWTKS